MKFIIFNTDSIPRSFENYRKLLKDYKIEDLNISFKNTSYIEHIIEINTLFDLLNLINILDKNIVISESFNTDFKYSIEIYDYYRE